MKSGDIKSSSQKITSKKLASEAGKVLKSKKPTITKAEKSFAASALAQAHKHNEMSPKEKIKLWIILMKWLKSLFSSK